MRPSTLRTYRRREGSPHASPIVVAFVVALLFAQAASAQQGGDPFAGVEEMVVTGSNTAALLAPASTAAVAFDTSDLEAYGVEDLGDIAAYVPNLEIRSQNATNASFFVRGVGLQDFGANASSSVPIFQDGVPRNPSATQLVGLFDIGGLSVLKGPQGSGNYRNASAGAFLIEAAKPEPEFSGFAKVSLFQIVSVDARDALRYDFETAVGAPIFEDWISMRLSGRYSHENAFWENGCANRVGIEDRAVNQTFCGEDLGGLAPRISYVKEFARKYLGEVDDFGFRGQLRVTPPDTPLDLVMRVEISRLNRDSTTGQNIGVRNNITDGRDFLGLGDDGNYWEPDNRARYEEILAFWENNLPVGVPRRAARFPALQQLEKEIYKRPFDRNPFRGNIDRPGRTILETHVASMTATLDFDDFDVEINGGFIDYRKSEFRDSDLSPNLAFPSASSDQAWEVYGDIEFSGEELFSVPLDWQVGGYGMHEQVEAASNQIVFDSIRIVNYQQEIYAFGVFAQARYEFLEAFTLAGGIRYNSERKDMELFGQRRRLDGTLVIGFDGNSRNQRTWDFLTGFAEIRYEFTEDVGAYVKYAKGFKAGHFNPARAGIARDTERGFADPEQIDSFEWGVDFATWAGRVSGNANFFYYNYKNYQVFRLSSTVTGRLPNDRERAAGDRNYGAEARVRTSGSARRLRPRGDRGSEHERLNFGWLDTSLRGVHGLRRTGPSLGGTQVGVTIRLLRQPAHLRAPNLQVVVTSSPGRSTDHDASERAHAAVRLHLDRRHAL